MERTCHKCENSFKIRTLRQKYCSRECRLSQYRLVKHYTVSTDKVGCISEAFAVADLFKRGYEVFKALNPSANCDLIVAKDGILSRVQVRTQYLKNNGQLKYGPKTGDLGKQDVFAFVLGDGSVVYQPPLEPS